MEMLLSDRNSKCTCGFKKESLIIEGNIGDITDRANLILKPCDIAQVVRCTCFSRCLDSELDSSVSALIFLV